MPMGPLAALSLAKGVFDFGSSIWQASKARKQEKRLERKRKKQNQKQRELENIYKNIDTSNPYLNMENTMEDLTVNQKQADFERQAFQQTQANIMGNLRGAAGGSGIASLAQSLAQQGQIAAQKSSASIGAQEAANQRAERAQAGQLQAMERKGEVYSREQERDKTETLMGLQLSKLSGTNQRLAQARQAKLAGVSGAIDTGLGILTQDIGIGPGGEGPLIGEDTEWPRFNVHDE